MVDPQHDSDRADKKPTTDLSEWLKEDHELKVQTEGMGEVYLGILSMRVMRDIGSEKDRLPQDPRALGLAALRQAVRKQVGPTHKDREVLSSEEFNLLSQTDLRLLATKLLERSTPPEKEGKEVPPFDGDPLEGIGKQVLKSFEDMERFISGPLSLGTKEAMKGVAKMAEQLKAFSMGPAETIWKAMEGLRLPTDSLNRLADITKMSPSWEIASKYNGILDNLGNNLQQPEKQYRDYDENLIKETTTRLAEAQKNSPVAKSAKSLQEISEKASDVLVIALQVQAIVGKIAEFVASSSDAMRRAEEDRALAREDERRLREVESNNKLAKEQRQRHWEVGSLLVTAFLAAAGCSAPQFLDR